MRITRLELAGFGPYRNPQQVDFRRFDDDGIFLITGRTGAGKSSILDAICFALYGEVPRYDGRDKQVRSQHCLPDDGSEVVLELVLGDAEYRIRRTPRYERAKRTGRGTTTAEPEASLAVREGDGWRPIATKPRDVGIELAAILPIRSDQFLQVILLAQGRFQEFLLAPTERRRALLRTLFGTDRFERLELDLLERRRDLGQQVADAAREVALQAGTVAAAVGLDAPAEPTTDWFRAAVDGAAVAATAAASEVDRARAAERAAAAAAAAVIRLQEVQRRRDDAQQQLRRLEQARGEIDALRVALQAAGRAATVEPAIAAAERADGDLRAAGEEHAAAAAAVPQRDEPDALLTLLGGLEHPAELERRLPALRERCAAAERLVHQATAAVTERERVLADLPERLVAARTAARAAADAAADEPAARGAVADAERALAAARQAERLATVLAEEERAEATAATESIRATGAVEQLLARRVQGQAFELAAALAPEQPCPVCGSVEHPAPATTDVPPVLSADVEQAREAAVRAARALEQAGERVRGAERELAVARTASGGGTVDSLTGVLAAENARLQAAGSAVAERDRLDAQVRRLETEAERGRDELDQARATLTRAEAELAAARGEADVAAGAIAEARGDARSVADRVVLIRDALARLRRLEAAERALATARGAAERAAAECAARLAAAGFADAEAARAAALDDDTLALAGARIRAADDERAAAQAVLAEPEVAAAPAAPVDPAPAISAAEQARSALEAASAESGRLRGLADDVAATAARAIALLARTEAQQQQYRAIRDLAATVHGDEPNTRRMRLETYVLAAQLEQILAAANLRLQRMTSGRYSLDLDDERQHRNVETGLGIGVRDAHTGQVRQAVSLSGGEMFLASLALALGLAEVVSAESGGVSLDTLFVDEGFGSLDGETLDVAMAALDDLRAGGRTIGLISHVESMQERIPAKLAVEVLPGGDSRIVQGVPVTV